MDMVRLTTLGEVSAILGDVQATFARSGHLWVGLGNFGRGLGNFAHVKKTGEGPMDRLTNGRAHPLIDMRGRI